MEERYNFSDIEQRAHSLWSKSGNTSPASASNKKTYSMFLIPPNASGPLHIGNALMIAIQDVIARYHRSKGDPTLWIPGTDHGGYETQVTYEREVGDIPDSESRAQVYSNISKFVDNNNKTIVRQITSMGASVDWSRFRFTLDDSALRSVNGLFNKMVSDNLIYRSSYMVNYCTSCATVLADIELKEVETTTALYHIKFPIQHTEEFLTFITTRPEFLFSITHALVHPQDTRFSNLIGKVLINPVTGSEIAIVESKRKFDPANLPEYLPVFSPSSKKYDFEYAIRNNIPTRDLLNWDGTLLEYMPGAALLDARETILTLLASNNFLGEVKNHTENIYLCKKGHTTQNIIRMTWFLNLDSNEVPLRKKALDALQRDQLTINPFWRKKGIVDWIGKMHNWPIARQNVWGITIPIWYEVTDPSLFTVWFLDAQGVKHHGNLQVLLDEGYALEDISQGLERIYAAEGTPWTLQKEEGKTYLHETDTFDTWFSSSAWSTTVFDDLPASEFARLYPSSAVVIGYDLIRLSIARKILFGVYLTNKIPFSYVYIHHLLLGSDGQKMSKSLGNAVTLDHYLEKYGADVTRLGLVSYTGLNEDFTLSDNRLESYVSFAQRLWKMGRVCEAANTYFISAYEEGRIANEDTNLLAEVEKLGHETSILIDKFLFAQAQEKIVSLLSTFEHHANGMLSIKDAESGLSVFYAAFKDYLVVLHPFMPFMTEDIYSHVFTSQTPLAATQRKVFKRNY